MNTLYKQIQHALLFFSLTISIIGCTSVRTKPDSEIAVRDMAITSYWFTATNGCRVADAHSEDDSTYEWSGSCQNGLVTGCGQLLRKTLGQVIKRMEGCFSAGLKNGVITESVSFGMNMEMKSKFKYTMGVITGSGDEPASQQPVVQKLPINPKTSTSDNSKSTGRGAVHPEELERRAQEANRLAREAEQLRIQREEAEARKQREKEAQDLRELQDLSNALQQLSNTLKRK